MKQLKLPVLGIILIAVILTSGCIVNPAPVLNTTGSTTGGVLNVTDANNQFAFELYSKLKESEDGNIFFSPYSISTCLAMVYEGARGQTAEEIQGVFHFPINDSERRPNFASIYNTLNKAGKPYQLSTANALWAQQDYIFLDEYFQTVEEYYGGKVANMDFVTQTEQSRQTINTWVEEQTNNRIKDLLPEGSITAITRLVLTNAIYFKGDWIYQFDRQSTRESDFKITPDNVVRVPMMYLENDDARFNYTETDDLQVLELPYKGDDLSMLILLPKKNLESIGPLTAEKLTEYREMLSEEEVTIYLPKFEFNTKYSLSHTLKQMGMPTAFSEAADFSGMTGQRDLFIGFVIHQAFVKVDEEGTEAAAATGAGMIMSLPPQPKIFRADHPFIFLIQEKTTGNILFFGRVVDPSAE